MAKAMADDIFADWGFDAPKPQVPRATSGGVEQAKPLPYSHPVGPTTFSHEGPGLADHTNHGCCGTQGKH